MTPGQGEPGSDPYECHTIVAILGPPKGLLWILLRIYGTEPPKGSRHVASRRLVAAVDSASYATS